MKEFLQREWKFITMVCILLIALGIGYYEYRRLVERQEHQPIKPVVAVNTAGEVSKKGEAQVVYLQGQGSHTKEVVYVPKELDPKTGQFEKTDVELQNKPSTVYVEINGKEFAVPTDSKEQAKFEKGKLVITEQSEMRLKITAPKPALHLGLGWSRDGLAGQLNGPLYKNVSWWVYGDRKTVAGGLQFPITQ